jgi:exodeoxyribonuclease-5
MISDHIEKTILKKLVDAPTNDQLKLISLLAEFIIKSSDDGIFLISGYAGTGKTTVVSALINALEEFKIKTVLLAPTGRAAKVLNSFSGKPAYTIQKKYSGRSHRRMALANLCLVRTWAQEHFMLLMKPQ